VVCLGCGAGETGGGPGRAAARIDRQAYEETIERLEEEVRRSHAEILELRDAADEPPAAMDCAEVHDRYEAELAAKDEEIEKCLGGIETAFNLGSRLPKTPIPSAPTRSRPADTATAPSVSLKAIDAQPTEKNSVWWRYAWQMTVANAAPYEVRFRAEIELLDGRGFIVDDATEYLTIRGSQRATYTGSILVDSSVAANVVSVRAEVYPRR